ncbi:dipeptide ABC transporter ATP-binding protein [Paracoccus aestuarii]|uniref:Dipeptide ABC transporter ATP-binding protein n=1 Tax=Paracoccus aestuarii TaxID=453842 RepID=A0A418ZXL0_9RHOB|nr:dipeptide ABC transporter ATP-binding protein [Paracoccus aestuarii]RJL05224.1 dipeptide ABC transporter ATP-binding protein [Paracoccus aestuarii]WCQ99170.1 dipeptide ABC transporter ATP-binding protein [Paracoccus aestuarii]
MSDPILTTTALEKRFTSGKGIIGKPTVIHAVNGVSLSVERGETFAIVGESGCGKSTLARLLLRLLEPTEGTVTYDGQDLTGLSAARMRKLRAEMQFIFQDPFSSLNPRMTVETIVGEPLLVHSTLSRKERRARVADLLTKVGLRPDHADRYPHEFSGGQRQRICVARALASGPKLLIGDEPVSALDVSVQAQIVNLLEDLKDDFGLTLIIIAHDLSVIRHMADRVAVMYLGEVVELAATEDLYSTPRHPYTRALLSAIPVPSPGGRGQIAHLGGDIPSPANPPPGCKFHTRCPHATEICRTTRPVLEEGTAHQTACHHWRDLPTLSEPAPTPERSPATAARFALWREHST